MKKLLLVISCLMLCACASTTNFQNTIATWKGASANTLVDIWGYPDQIKNFEGNKLYVYKYVDKGRNPVNVTQFDSVRRDGNKVYPVNNTFVSGGGTYNYNCTTTFEVDKDKKITRASSRGNDCTASDDFVKTFSYGSK